MKLHVLKIKEEYYEEVYIGNKTFELRKNDRDYEVGDIIHFTDVYGKEFIDFLYGEDGGKYNIFRITYVLKNVHEYGLDKDYCILGIKRLEEK